MQVLQAQALPTLLANRGIAVTLVERRRDFAREFRGEILMPSGIEALQQLGLGDALAPNRQSCCVRLCVIYEQQV